MKYVVVIVGLTIVGIFIGWFAVSLSMSGDKITVPDLNGLSLVEAMKKVEARKLFLQLKDEHYHATISRDHILAQDPVAGVAIKSGRTIYVTVSKGPKEMIIPDLVDLPWREIGPYLERSGFELGFVSRVHSTTIERDRVISQQPKPGSQSLIGEKVNLLVSQGFRSRYFVVPDWIGYNISDSRAAADRMRVRIEIKDRMIMPEYPSGTIIEQSPLPGHQIREGDIISLVISRKSPLEDMQDVDYFPFTYFVPAGLTSKKLRIILAGPNTEEIELLVKEVLPSEKVSVLVPKQPGTYLKVYLNEELVASEEPVRTQLTQ